MEIKIDLREILRDEYGDMESLAESIKRQVIDKLTRSLSEGIQKKVDIEIATLIDEQIKNIVQCQMPSLFTELIDQEYEKVGKWGERGSKTTMRKELINTLTGEMVYKQARYDSDKNYFTKNIDSVVEQKMKDFKEQFDSKVNEVFTKGALDYAFKKMQDKLNA